MNDEYESLLARLRARRSIREFLDRPVAREDLARLFEAARWAPSNHNRQPWRFLVLEDRARIAALAAGVGHRLGEL
ncbi:MAG: nitroreductase family protein, partial [Opitutaceae bacterium]|nr:nitroreductase family protein [Opitutaceae bacterium]